jgi:hypothetical protein
MTKYIIERQYLLPVFQHLIIEAPDLSIACQTALDDDNWESGVMRDPPKQDYDTARPTEITRIVEIPSDYGEIAALDGVIYELPALDVPPEFTNEPRKVT